VPICHSENCTSFGQRGKKKNFFSFLWLSMNQSESPNIIFTSLDICKTELMIYMKGYVGVEGVIGIIGVWGIKCGCVNVSWVVVLVWNGILKYFQYFPKQARPVTSS